MPYIGRELDRGNYLKLDDISSSFDGSTTTFNLTNGGNAFYPGSAFSILVVLAGVVQEPEAAYQINQTQITFASAPLAGDQFFCIVLGQALGVNTPANGSVNGAQLAKPFNYDNYFYLDDANNRVGVGTATPMTPLHVEGTGRFTDLTVTGDLTVEGTTSTLDTVVTEVDKLEVGANNNTVGVAITQSGSGDILNLYDGSSSVFSVSDGGTVTASGDISIADKIIHTGDTNTAIRFPAADTFTVETSGSERLRVTSNGRVGIGTVPNNNTTLDIRGAGASVIRLNAFANASYTDLRHNQSGKYLEITPSSASNQSFIVNKPNGDEALRITSDGSVGIGTDNPQSQFEVFGTSPIIRSKHSTSQKYTQINHNGTDGYLDWSSGDLILRGASNSEKVRITNGGLVGINSTSPDENLCIYDSGFSGIKIHSGRTADNQNIGGLLFYNHVGVSTAYIYGKTGGRLVFGTAGTERLRITSNGLLQLDNGNQITAADTTTYIGLGGGNSTSNGANMFLYGGSHSSNASAFVFRTNTTERVRITSAGNVGIGTDNPTVKLVSTGLIKIQGEPTNLSNLIFTRSDRSWSINNETDFRIYTSSGTTDSPSSLVFAINGGGNVGINETTPEAKLELDGRFRILDNSDGTPSTGKGLEISYYTSDDMADILSYDRGGSAYKKLQLRGSSIELKRNNSVLCNIGTGGNSNTVGFSTTANLVTNAEKIAVRGYSSFKSTNPAYAAIYLGSEGDTTDTANQLLMWNAGGANRGGIGYVPNTGELRFNNQYFLTFCTGSSILNGTERLRITATGFVGIGTDNPSTKLEVQGDVTATNYVFEADYPTSAPALDLNFAREKKLDSRITFTRNSVATYFDAKSSEVLEENNMDYASDFANQWSAQGFASISAGSWARPIPGWDSQQVTQFTENTSGGTHRIYRSFYNYFYDNDQLDKVYTISFFAKYSSGRQFLQLNGASLNYNARVIFDIQNGSVSDYGSALYAGVISHGNGWYRCWATIRADTISPVQQVITCPVGGNGTATGNGESYTGNGSNFYLWGYQVEFSDTLGPFVQTTGKTFRKLGPVIKTVSVDEPRFVYDPSTKESLGLLIEQEATNKQPFTNNLTSAIATNGGSSEVSTWNNIVRAPNGLLEGGRVKGSGASGGSQRIYFNYAIANGEDGAWSLFLKADPNNGGDIIVQAYTNTFIAGNSALNINLNDGTYNAVGPSNDLFYTVESYPNGWYRVTMGGTSSGSTNGSMNINIVDSTSAARAATSSSDKAYFIWGVQFETGSLNASTSYIENTSTGTKTRSAELAQIRGSNFSSWFNNTEGTILAEYRGGQYTSEIPLHISDESYRSTTSIQIGSSSSGPISGYVTTASINNRGTSEASWQANTAYPTEGESIKTALTYKHNYAQMVTTDGSGTYTGSVDTSVNLPWLNMMTIGKDSYYGIYNNNPIKRLAFYGNTLTEAQLQNIIKY